MAACKLINSQLIRMRVSSLLTPNVRRTPITLFSSLHKAKAVMTQTYRVFIDGQAGTTGLQIQQRLANHPQIELLTIDEAQRKDAGARQALMQQADVTILCLPDEAAKEAV